jgi:ADP-heptose:LPS heptosyltransferase
MEKLKHKMTLKATKFIVRVENIILDVIRALLFASTNGQSPKTILVLRFGAIGDFIVALPALRLLRKHYPHSKIVLLTAVSLNRKWHHANAVVGGMIFGNHLVDEKVGLLGSDVTNWRRLAETRQCIKKLDPNMCIFFPFSGEPFRSRLIKMLFLRFLGCRKNLFGYHTDSSLGFFRKIQYEAGMYDHQVSAALKAVKELGINGGEVVFEINIPIQDFTVVEKWWRENGLHEVDFPVAICPSSKEEVKRWPIENFRDLGLLLLEDPRVRIILVGGDEDREHASLLVNAWGKRAISFVGKASVLQTAEILRRCQLFIGVDSGPMHLATALNRPTIGIFASVVFPVFWKPWGEQSIMIRHIVQCEFCFTTDGVCPTRTMECIKGISVEKVFQVVLKLMNSAQKENSPCL